MWNLIPQVFYDLLARVIPGAALITLTFIVLFGPKPFADFVLKSPEGDKLFSTSFLLLWGLGSYLTGFLLDRLWDMTLGRLASLRDTKTEAHCQQECLAEHNRVQKALKHPELDIVPGSLPRAFVMRDHLRQIAPEEVSRLNKVRAERRLCQVLLLGFFTLLVVNGVYLLIQLEVIRLVIEILLVVAIVACWGGERGLHRHL